MLDTTFICPYMKIKLKHSCKLESCPYNKSTVKSNCIWEYISSKNSISITQLSIIIDRPLEVVERIKERAIFKLMDSKVRNKVNNIIVDLKYCYKCGKAYNLYFVNNNYRCKDRCEIFYSIKKFIETRYNKPISHVLIILSDILDISNISKLLNLSKKEVNLLYKSILGDYSVLVKNNCVKFSKRKKELELKSFGRRARNLSFALMHKRINNLSKGVFS